MKRLTDEAVAKALGWKCLRAEKVGKYSRRESWLGHGCFVAGRQNPNCPNKVPAFTTSLDAIVAEIEARGLLLSTEVHWEHHQEGSDAVATIKSAQGFEVTGSGQTWPLALASALLAYLKETR